MEPILTPNTERREEDYVDWAIRQRLELFAFE
jgi:hypothetical protein